MPTNQVYIVIIYIVMFSYIYYYAFNISYTLVTFLFTNVKNV